MELADARECCGFGGTFAVNNADVSRAILTDKRRHVIATRAEVCVAADNSFLMQASTTATGRASFISSASRGCTVHASSMWWSWADRPARSLSYPCPRMPT
ncbi:MAG TPA: (Fe-S)-binding protein [Solirubrobacteraceae bacterium]|nr:(Fe-S)-binding protein [Solirubrobacteraceae bacterium]